MLDYTNRIKKIKEMARKIETEYEEQRKKEEERKKEEQQKFLQIQKQRMRDIFLKYIIGIIEENIENKQKVEKIIILSSERLKYDNEDDGLDMFCNKTEEIFIIEIHYKYEGKDKNTKYEIEPCVVGYGVETFNDFMCMKYGEEETNSIILEGFLKVEFDVEEPKSIVVTPNYE